MLPKLSKRIGSSNAVTGSNGQSNSNDMGVPNRASPGNSPTASPQANATKHDAAALAAAAAAGQNGNEKGTKGGKGKSGALELDFDVALSEDSDDSDSDKEDAEKAARHAVKSSIVCKFYSAVFILGIRRNCSAKQITVVFLLCK